jgi:hypothetical protein
MTNEQIKGILENFEPKSGNITFFQIPIRELDLPQECWIKMIEIILDSVNISAGFKLKTLFGATG